MFLAKQKMDKKCGARGGHPELASPGQEVGVGPAPSGELAAPPPARTPTYGSLSFGPNPLMAVFPRGACLPCPSLQSPSGLLRRRPGKRLCGRAAAPSAGVSELALSWETGYVSLPLGEDRSEGAKPSGTPNHPRFGVRWLKGVGKRRAPPSSPAPPRDVEEGIGPSGGLFLKVSSSAWSPWPCEPPPPRPEEASSRWGEAGLGFWKGSHGGEASPGCAALVPFCELRKGGAHHRRAAGRAGNKAASVLPRPALLPCPAPRPFPAGASGSPRPGTGRPPRAARSGHGGRCGGPGRLWGPSDPAGRLLGAGRPPDSGQL